MNTADLPTLTPAVDIYENDEQLLLLADVPGAQATGLNLNVERNVLSLEATVDGEHRYVRSFELSDAIDADEITADLDAGVLTVTLPKAAASKPRTIPVVTH